MTSVSLDGNGRVNAAGRISKPRTTACTANESHLVCRKSFSFSIGWNSVAAFDAAAWWLRTIPKLGEVRRARCSAVDVNAVLNDSNVFRKPSSSDVQRRQI